MLDPPMGGIREAEVVGDVVELVGSGFGDGKVSVEDVSAGTGEMGEDDQTGIAVVVYGGGGVREVGSDGDEGKRNGTEERRWVRE